MPLPLDQQICFTLYATSMAINRTYKPLLDEMGITYPQYLVLCVLGEEGGATVGGIAARLALESSTVTPPVKRLEQAGLVKRKRNKTDERQVLVQLTAAGRQLLERASCLTETLTKRSGMTDADIEGLNARIQALRAALVEPRGD
ncbi:MAG: MarR family transcriptional regulator [Alphaproteobacteria bacterium]|jgi:DNA-binding MarR family transcriptional regulator|nr:MarR family transcriptional regulator [Alphaproteobacteria bacterium]